jgi:hypothetical protein
LELLLLYLMGGHLSDAAGSHAGFYYEGTYGIVYTILMSTNRIICAELHETACHDSTVGAIGHCPNPECACYEDVHEVVCFCASCVAKLRAKQRLDD